MSQDSEKPQPRQFHARWRTWRVALLVELAAASVLIATALWIVTSYRAGGELARIFLHPGIWLLVLLISGVGTALNFAQYYLGRRGTEAVLARFPQLEGEQWARIEAAFRRWGARTLILSGVPALGAALTVAAGAFGIGRMPFLLWTFAGKVLRNWVLVLVFLASYEMIDVLTS